MQLKLDSPFLEWFTSWEGEFEWDEGNRDKNKKHGISWHQIETIFDSPVYIAGRILGSEEARWLILGEEQKRGWSLIVTKRGKSLRVISCRRQRKKEVKFYESRKKEN